MNHARAILDACQALGFAASGIARAEPSAFAPQFRAWLAQGKHGTMTWLAETTDARLDPAKVFDDARAIIMVADVYASRAVATRETPTPGVGRIARYARGRDYHRVIKQRLHHLCDRLRLDHPAAAFRAFVDTAPVLEREHAARAGLGWTGKHTLTIHPRLGSYLLLGGVLTTLDIHPPEGQHATIDHCGTCTRCIDACPTNAITPYSVDASRCISYLTIERQDPIPPEFHRAIGDWLFGCDICQEVCPHNSPRDAAWLGPAAHPRADYASRRTGLALADLLDWTEEDRRRELAGTPMTWATLEMLKRNARIVMHNQRPPEPG